MPDDSEKKREGKGRMREKKVKGIERERRKKVRLGE